MAGSRKKSPVGDNSKVVDAEVISENPGDGIGEQTHVEDASPSEMASNGNADLENNADTVHSETEVPVVAARPAKKSFFAPLIGGLLAGSIGFLVAQYLGNDRWPFENGPSVTDELAEQISGQRGLLEGQGEAIEQLNAEVSQATEILGSKPDMSALDGLVAQQQATEQQGEGLADMLNAFEQRLMDLENRPIPDVGATREAVELYGTELAAMRQMFDAELAKISATQDAELAKIAVAQDEATNRGENASEIARAGLIRSAMSELRVAVQSGQPFDRPLASLGDAGIEIPAGLQSLASEGVPTLADLGREFPAAARLSLGAAAQENTASGNSGGLAAFVRDQLGVRSLQPREGDSTDAVLSRAEAAVKAEDIPGALAEVETLTGLALQEMQGWADSAHLRENAMADISKLSASIEN